MSKSPAPTAQYLAQQRAKSAEAFASAPINPVAVSAPGAIRAPYAATNAPGSSWSRSQLVRAGFWLSLGFGAGGFMLALIVWLFYFVATMLQILHR